MATVAQEILQKDTDKLNFCITDSIKYSNTFHWSFDDDSSITINAKLLLRSYISEDLYQSFQFHFTVEIFAFLIKTNVWKFRSLALKQRKAQHGITKRSFIEYRRTPPGRTNTSQIFSRYRSYICPQMNSFRNYYNRADLIYIILASSNFLHSGSMFQQLTMSYLRRFLLFLFRNVRLYLWFSFLQAKIVLFRSLIFFPWVLS